MIELIAEDEDKISHKLSMLAEETSPGAAAPDPPTGGHGWDRLRSRRVSGNHIGLVEQCDQQRVHWRPV